VTPADQLEGVSRRLFSQKPGMTTLADLILEMPDDWWKTTNTCATLLDWFDTHILGLLIAGQTNGTPQQYVFSGFLLIRGERLLWISAGHVIDQINDALTSPSFHLTAMVWLDNYPATGAENMAAHNRKLKLKSWSRSGIDVGAVQIEGLDAANLLSNPQVNALEPRVWANLKMASPEGYYLIGYPAAWTESSIAPAEGGKSKRSVTAHAACVPVEEVLRDVDSDDPFWSFEKAFYAKVVPYVDWPEFEVETIVGMSGGPILSIARNPQGQLAYRLVGVQSSWLPSSKVIRATGIDIISHGLVQWLDS
jgi:hypothetical protein